MKTLVSNEGHFSADLVEKSVMIFSSSLHLWDEVSPACFCFPTLLFFEIFKCLLDLKSLSALVFDSSSKCRSVAVNWGLGVVDRVNTEPLCWLCSFRSPRVPDDGRTTTTRPSSGQKLWTVRKRVRRGSAEVCFELWFQEYLRIPAFLNSYRWLIQIWLVVRLLMRRTEEKNCKHKNTQQTNRFMKTLIKQIKPEFDSQFVDLF